MARNDDGEFELVLGNRQLLSVFFILVVLLGVFFTMGYIVGKNNPNSDAVATSDGHKPVEVAGNAKPPVIVNPGDSEKPAPAPDPPKPEPTRDPEPVKPIEPPKVETKKPEPPKIESKKPEPPKVETKKPEPVKATPPPPVRTGEPTPGTYLQVAAVDKAGGEAIAATLRKKNFPAMVAPGPSEKLWRVLVGPLSGADAVSKSRMDLEGIGFKGPIVKKY